MNFGDFGVVKNGSHQWFEEDSCFLIKKSKLCKNCKNGNVVKTIGGSKILKRTSYDNKPLDLGGQGFPAVGARFLSKSSQDSNERGIRRYKGLNNNILLEAITFNNNLRGGRPASTSLGSP